MSHAVHQPPPSSAAVHGPFTAGCHAGIQGRYCASWELEEECGQVHSQQGPSPDLRRILSSIERRAIVGQSLNRPHDCNCCSESARVGCSNTVFDRRFQCLTLWL